jgi:TatD DNase family protein
MLVDSHCHLDDERFGDDLEAVITRAHEAGVTRMVSIGTGDGPPDLEAAIRIADRHASVYATAGVHPHDAAKCTDTTLAALESLLGHPKVLALGEIGLDYHYDNSPRDTQRARFVEQLGLAARAAKPIVIHTREAWDDTFALLEQHWDRTHGGVMHCFSGGPAEATRCLEMGFHLSFAGIVTYPKATAIHEAARLTPLDRLLVETDAPYLAPVPHRGKRNEPAFAVEAARRVAALQGRSWEEVAAATTANWERLFPKR